MLFFKKINKKNYKKIVSTNFKIIYLQYPRT